MVTATVVIVQWYCVVCGVYCGYSNCRYSAMILCCVEIIVVTATVDIVQWYCVLLEFIVVTATVVIVQWYCVCVELIVVTATVVILQWYCVLCGIYCGYSNSSCSAMLLCRVGSLMWLQQK